MADVPVPAFAWEAWYAAVGGRSIRIEAVDQYLHGIYAEQYPRFAGDVAPSRREFDVYVRLHR
jgi:hypothetical protein